MNATKKNKQVQSELAFGLDLLLSILKLPLLLFIIPFSKKARTNFIAPLKKILDFFKQTKITTTLILINIIIFLIQNIFFSKQTIITIAQLNLKLTNYFFLDKILNIIITWFLHANLAHLVNNMIALLVLGRVVEKHLKEKYLLIYLLSGFTGSVISLFLNQPGIGASGAISGIILSAILIKPFYLSFIAIIPIPIFLIGWASIYADISGVFSKIPSQIGYGAHIGGYISALIISLILIKKSKKHHELKKGLLINLILLLIFALLILIK